MITQVMSGISTNSVEAVKMAIDFMKMQGQTVLKLIDEQKQITKNVSNPEGMGNMVDVYA
ncbi:motility protein [Candidatus Brocadia pituitae]|nr:motility protein [Candidatus Brocadia pituitae]